MTNNKYMILENDITEILIIIVLFVSNKNKKLSGKTIALTIKGKKKF